MSLLLAVSCRRPTMCGFVFRVLFFLEAFWKQGKRRRGRMIRRKSKAIRAETHTGLVCLVPKKYFDASIGSWVRLRYREGLMQDVPWVPHSSVPCRLGSLPVA